VHTARHSYSIFASALSRNRAAEWLFPQEKATLQNAAMLTSEAKMLERLLPLKGVIGLNIPCTV
jgi:type IV secretory pathway VirB9-like protein